MGKWYTKVIEIDDSEFKKLGKMLKKHKIDDCFKCEEDIKI